MKTKDIVVGRYYVNRNFPSQLYLGIGKRVMWEGTAGNSESNFTNKGLVIVRSDENYIGQLVQNPEDCHSGVWDNFEVVDIQ